MCTEVRAELICGHLPLILAEAQILNRQLLEADDPRARELDRAVQRSTEGNVGDVYCRHGLYEHIRDAKPTAVRCVVGDVSDELEELRRVHQRVRLLGFDDQSLLLLLRCEVSSFSAGESVRSDDRERDVMRDSDRSAVADS